MAPLTAAQLLEHPEYPKVIWDLEPTKKGTIPVAQGRGGPFDISYEVHGTGDICLVWIMGLGAFKTAWQRQTHHFSHTEPNSRKYRSLIFDNRGMGASSKPTLRYTTTAMAHDTLDLLDALTWTSARQVHLIGVSMGGMIAQEVALLIPSRIASLILVSTAARLENTVGFVENLRGRINLFLPKEPNRQLAETKARLFSQEFLDREDPDGKFPTNGDRFAAQELRKRTDTLGFTRKGFMLQAVAAGWHYKDKEALRQLGDRVGRDRIAVLHGTGDRMITFHHAEVLRRELARAGDENRDGEEAGAGDITFRSYEGKGHVLMWEEKEDFNRFVEETVDKVRKLDAE